MKKLNKRIWVCRADTVCVFLFALLLSFFISPPLLFPASSLGVFSYAALIVYVLNDESRSHLNRAFIILFQFVIWYTVLYQLVFFTPHISGFLKKMLFIVWHAVPYGLAVYFSLKISNWFRKGWCRDWARLILFWSISLGMILTFEPFLMPGYFTNGLYLADFVPSALFVYVQNPEILNLLVLVLVNGIWLIIKPKSWNWLIGSLLLVMLLFAFVNIRGEIDRGESHFLNTEDDIDGRQIAILSVEPKYYFSTDVSTMQRLENGIRNFVNKNADSPYRMVVFAESDTLFNFFSRNGDAAYNFDWVRKLSKSLQTDMFLHVRGSPDKNNPTSFRENKSYFVVVRPDGTYSQSEKQHPMYLAEQEIHWKPAGTSWFNLEHTGMVNGRAVDYLESSFGLKVIPAICFDGVFPAVLDTADRRQANMILVSANLADFAVTLETYRFQLASHITQGLASARSMGIPYVYTSNNGSGFSYEPTQLAPVSESFRLPVDDELIERHIPVMKVSAYHYVPSAWMARVCQLVTLMILAFGLLLRWRRAP